ncbi:MULTISPECIES: hypothetical protein [unclassified Vibrio]|uniref:N-acetyltransferase domain-containing protein n=1 Tax=Vibrio sp. HB236076 TaxID=3232307 RepID=A0AB39HC72_9VIBR|nr:hypothetical protein [Vibrio sp. HB161653]MDP5253383.1 hypothetical protein [Vibrio sp. HB161653]
MASLLAVRQFQEGQAIGSDWLSKDYRVELATETDLETADSLYESVKNLPMGESYFRDYVSNVQSISEEQYCDVKYLIKKSDGSIVGYLGLDTNKRTINDFAHIPLIEDYDPLITLYIKQWLKIHPDYDKVYFVMRYGRVKTSPIDKHLGVVMVGCINPDAPDEHSSHCYFMRTE